MTPLIPLEKLAFIVEKARKFDSEVPGDDGESSALLGTPDNPAHTELCDAIAGLNREEQIELLALTWLGRGDFDRADWPDALRQATQTLSETAPTLARDKVDDIAATPMLACYLEEGLAAFGIALPTVEEARR